MVSNITREWLSLSTASGVLVNVDALKRAPAITGVLHEEDISNAGTISCFSSP